MTLFILGLNSTVAFANFFEEIKVREYLSSEKEIARRLFLNSNWKLAKSYLITASGFDEVVKRTKSKPDGLLKKTCGYTQVPDNVNIRHGRDYESKALKCYPAIH